MGADGSIGYEKRESVAYVTLDHPRALNALTLRMHEELRAVWDDFESDPAIRAGVLTGAGERAFCVGQDLKELAARIENGEAASTFGSRGAAGDPRLTERFSMTKPLIARVNGLALGGGFELALACDIIVAADHATFGLPEAMRGLIPGAGGLFRLTRQLPLKSAMGLLLTGRKLSAARAFELGLINDVVPAAELDACVDGWLQDIRACSPLSIRAIKDVAANSLHLSVEEAFAARYEWEERRRAGSDWIEGAQAFAEKRPPRWQKE